MTTSRALFQLADYALRGADVNERIHVFDAVAAFSQHIAQEERDALAQLAAAASEVATALRKADAAQLNFRELL